MAEEESNYVESSVANVPNYEVADHAFILSEPRLKDQHEASLKFVLDKVKEEAMAPFYKFLYEEYLPKGAFEWDETLYKSLVDRNQQNITELKERLQEVEEKDEGELEKAQAWVKLGEYYAQIGDKTNAEKTLAKALDKAVSTGSKIDIMLTITRLGFFYNDQQFVKEKLEQTFSMIEKGGDWERRNRYKTYKGVHCLAIRDFKEAANLLVDSLATFTSTELTSYENIATYASVAGLFALERTELKDKIIDSPELLSLMTNTPALQSISSLTISLYTSEYSSYFPFLLETYDKVLVPCKYLSKHADFFVREMRRKVYAQLLESYKTLSIKTMASAFGVSVDFLDKDLGKFIPNKQLNCVIDRVNGIVETNRPDNKNVQYHTLIKQGDGLLTKLQKYGTAVRLTGTDRVV
ncbi:proteasome regulatory particle lid subunit RPN7 [Lachancea thermotolerans CBS 6340]|uniref:KLTH0F12232p n=1 Tax=Lachancea thermotolerans (strain ATCC 56472 / CBS 6340 / NRRL Y-8284) TaxID=559295 RepID=C5DLD9_LACTC|nr:KLTH0F12232p [Lachancea thermotolerans CBS 6340]CAR24290.1 KLTH0F12232p [Lachancea thermotolerans CBS 6340]